MTQKEFALWYMDHACPSAEHIRGIMRTLRHSGLILLASLVWSGPTLWRAGGVLRFMVFILVGLIAQVVYTWDTQRRLLNARAAWRAEFAEKVRVMPDP